MMYARFSPAWLLTFSTLFLLAGCATSGTALAPDHRIYSADVDFVIPAAAEAFTEIGLEIQQQGWRTDSTYAIDGHERSDFVRADGGGVQVAALQVIITRHHDGRTAVLMTTSRREVAAAASSADRDTPAVRRFFARLDRKMGQ